MYSRPLHDTYSWYVERPGSPAGVREAEQEVAAMTTHATGLCLRRRTAELLDGVRARALARAVAAQAARAALVAGVIAASVSIWTVSPLAWLWVGSQLSATGEPALLPYLVVLAGIAGTA